MWDLNRNYRDVGFQELRSDDRRYALIGLIFEHEVDVLADEQIGVAQRFLRAVSIVHNYEANLFAGGNPLETGSHFAAEFRIRLSREAEPELVPADRQHLGGVETLCGPLHHPSA